MVEISKIKNNRNPPNIYFMSERRNNTHNLRNFQEFATKQKTVKMGLETSSLLWSILAENLIQINSLVQFKESVRK